MENKTENFNSNLQNSNELQEIIILTNLEEGQVSCVCRNPNNSLEMSQLISPIASLDKNNEIKMDSCGLWNDGKIIEQLKPGTIYKVTYKNFELSDVRYKYPSSFILESMEECENLEENIKEKFQTVINEILKREEQRKQLLLEEEMLIQQEREKWIREHTFQYKDTKFIVDLNWDDLDFDDDIDDDKLEKKLIGKFIEKKDENIEMALKGAIDSNLETAKDWAEEPDSITEEVFIKNLLAEEFYVLINGLNSYDVHFKTNDMFTDHILVSEIKNRKCLYSYIQG